jgi:N-acetylneuraminate synthase
MSNKSPFNQPVIVAEIGCNHMGQFELAKELIVLAKECKADYAKFQKRNPRELLTEDQYNAPHPNTMHSYGNTYGEHREFLELDKKQHAELKKFCDEVGIKYAVSVWDVTSAKEIIELNPDYIKVPSACNNHFEMLKILRDNYKGDVHISLGMTTHQEEEQIIHFFEENNNAKNRLVVYSCTSGYPVKFEDICLLEISRIADAYGKRIKEVGFSGHHLGIAVDIAAYAIGARWIERHFTKDTFGLESLI